MKNSQSDLIPIMLGGEEYHVTEYARNYIMNTIRNFKESEGEDISCLVEGDWDSKLDKTTVCIILNMIARNDAHQYLLDNYDYINIQDVISNGEWRVPYGDFEFFKKLYNDGEINDDLYFVLLCISGSLEDEEFLDTYFKDIEFKNGLSWIDQMFKIIDIGKEKFKLRMNSYLKNRILTSRDRDFNKLLTSAIGELFELDKEIIYYFIDKIKYSPTHISNIEILLSNLLKTEGVDLKSTLDEILSGRFGNIELYRINFTSEQIYDIVKNNLLEVNELRKFVINNAGAIKFISLLRDINPNVRSGRELVKHLSNDNLIFVPYLKNLGVIGYGYSYTKNLFDPQNMVIYNSINNIMYHAGEVFQYCDENIEKFTVIQDALKLEDINVLSEYNSDLREISRFLKHISKYKTSITENGN